MKKFIILLLFVFIALAMSSCMVGLAHDSNYRNDPDYHSNNMGRHRGRYHDARKDRNYHGDRDRDIDATIIIR